MEKSKSFVKVFYSLSEEDSHTRVLVGMCVYPLTNFGNSVINGINCCSDGGCGNLELWILDCFGRKFGYRLGVCQTWLFCVEWGLGSWRLQIIGEVFDRNTR